MTYKLSFSFATCKFAFIKDDYSGELRTSSFWFYHRFYIFGIWTPIIYGPYPYSLKQSQDKGIE